jgi:pimeloyl-ACP methyl ester carboxylesterase
MLSFCGCANLPGTSISELENRTVSYSSEGEGTPVVVLEAGMGVSMSTWAPIFENPGEITKVYAYNRPGYGHSSIEEAPSSARILAEQLHQNLEATDHNPPYLLAGHSAGGLYVNMFARMYPEEVAGVLLIDSSHPLQFEYFKNDQPLLYSAFVTTTALGKTSYEASILENVHAEFDQAAAFPNVPLVVLTAEKSSLLETPAMRKQWLEFQADLAGMSTGAKHQVVEGSGHFIHRDKPQVVIDEITSLVNASRKIQ